MMINRRTRLISFRVSEEEYEALKYLRAAHGARSVSDMVRNSMLHVTVQREDHGALEKLQSYIAHLERRVVDLDRIVRDLAVAKSGAGETQADVSPGNLRSPTL